MKILKNTLSTFTLPLLPVGRHGRGSWWGLLLPPFGRAGVGILIIIAFTACKKDKSKTSVTGKVLDATTAAILPGATVYLKAVNDNCFSCQSSVVQTTPTDAKGNFGFNFTHDQALIYNVEASYNSYFSSANGGVYLKNSEKNNALLSLTPKAYLRVFIKNTSPFDGNDAIGYNTLGGGGAFYGMTVDTFVVKTVGGNQNSPIAWFVTKNNTQTSYNANVYCTAFDTTNYTINY